MMSGTDLPATTVLENAVPKSMTAFARIDEHDQQLGQWSWEIRSLNSRYLELHFKLPDHLRVIEPQLRQLLKASLSRGKIEVSVQHQLPKGGGQLVINEALVAELNQATNTVQTIIGPGPALNALELLRWPGVVETTPLALDPQQLLPSFSNCIQRLIDARQQEGKALKATIVARVNRINEIVEQAEQHMPNALARYRSQLSQKLNEYIGQLDSDRLEQEMVLLVQKSDIAEELDRLATHNHEIMRILESSGPIGRRLDFLMQELNREANTMSSKSITNEITAMAIDMKVLIEQMREQIQNLE